MTAPGSVQVDTREIRALRRRVKKAAPEARKTLDRELKDAGREAEALARGYTVKKTGKLAAGWRVSVTQGKGVAIRNARPQSGQHEYGRLIWLREGHPFNDATPDGPIASRGRGVQRRQVTLPNGKSVIEARLLIKRSRPGARAVEQAAEHALPKIDAAMHRALDELL